ncbi:MAG TPA: BTAD domain-containing putative transcriptional regulator, partial [Kribbellaceae bacterium]
MEFSALGPLRVVTGEGRLVTAPMLRRLLGVLLIRANAPVPAETLIGALWDEPQTDVTAQRLRLLAFRLRKELGDPERLKHQHGSYVLRVLPGELDVERFDLLRREAAETTDKDRTVALLREAVDLWRGEPYADLTAIAAVGDEALRLTEQRLAALEELYAAELDRGEGAAVIADLSDAAARYPLRERFHALLMIALHRGGRQAEALEAYQAARRHLVDELGLEPGAELRRIEAAILAGETPGAAPVARRRPLTPAQLPAGISTFAGRRDELRRLDELLGQTSLIVVNGTAGCGKTTLAVHWARAVRDRFPDGQLYVDLRGYSADRSVTPAEALAGFLRALGVPGDQLPPDEAQRTGLYRSLLAERRVLVVLDNAADAPQVRPLLTVTGGSLTVVTSRAALGGLAVSHDPRVVELAPMAPPDSLAVLRAVLGDERVDRESEAAARLVTLCGGLPLPLRIAAANLSGHTEAPINRLVSELDSAERLSELAVDGDPDLSVRNAFAVSYDALQPAAQLVFRRLGLFPGPELTPAIAAGLTGQGQATCARLLRELRMAHLLERSGADRYRLHDLLRLYAAERAEAADSADERRDAVRRVLASYLQVAQT